MADAQTWELGVVNRATVASFSRLVGDPNVLHFNVGMAQALGFPDVVVPGSLLTTLLLVHVDALLHDPCEVAIKFKRWVFAGERLLLQAEGNRVRLVTGDGRVCVVASLRDVTLPDNAAPAEDTAPSTASLDT